MPVTAPIIEGHVLSDLSEIAQGFPPIAGLQRAFGRLMFGNTEPSLIYSSKAVADDVLFRIIPRQRTRVTYNTKNGFLFNRAVWLQDDRLEGTRTIVLLNEAYPDNQKMNGYCEYPLQPDQPQTPQQQLQQLEQDVKSPNPKVKLAAPHKLDALLHARKR